MGKLLFSSVLLLFVQYACSELAVDSKSESFHDPDEIPYRISKLLNELGLLIMDLDEGYSNQMPPKIELENEVKARMYGRPRSDYFSRIRENYKSIQRRIGSNIPNTSDAKQDGFLPQQLMSFGSPDVTVLSRRERDTGHIFRANDGVASLFAATYRDFMSKPVTIPGDFQNDTEIILDSLSRSSMEALTKQFLSFGQAALDSGMETSEIIDNIDVITKSVLDHRRKSKKKSASLGEATQKGKPEASLIRRPSFFEPPPGPDGGSDVEVAQVRPSKVNPTKATLRKETILPVYTSDNVPIILRIGPEMGEPYKFLHRILSLHEVSLRVHGMQQFVEEAKGLKNPVEVLLVDLSDLKERNALLHTLRKFQRKRPELGETLLR